MIKQELTTTSVFQEKYRSMSKEEIIEQYGQDYDTFFMTLKLIPPGKFSEKFLNGWGIKEITAHIASWNLETIKGNQAVVDGGIPWFFDDEEKINNYNTKEIERKKKATLENNLQEIEITHNRLIKFLEKFPSNLFHQSFGKTWKGQEVTPSLVCSYRHYLHHTQDIIRWLEQE